MHRRISHLNSACGLLICVMVANGVLVAADRSAGTALPNGIVLPKPWPPGDGRTPPGRLPPIGATVLGGHGSVLSERAASIVPHPPIHAEGRCVARLARKTASTACAGAGRGPAARAETVHAGGFAAEEPMPDGVNGVRERVESKDAAAAEQKGLVCRHCGCRHFRVVYTRPAWGGRIMRRRECRHCGRRTTTFEAAG